MTASQAHRSYSQLTGWQRCGWQYKLARVDKVPQHPSWWLVGGKAVHTATEHYDQWLEGNPPAYPFANDDELRTTWLHAWNQEYEDTLQRATIPPEEWRAGGRVTKDKPNKEDGAWWRDIGGPQFFKAYIDWRCTYPNWQIATMPDGREGIELEFNVWVGQTPVRAFVDRVFEVTTPSGHKDLVVMDIKTGSSVPETPSQLGFYAALIEKAYGAEHRPPLGCFFMNRKGDITVPENLDTYTIDYWAKLYDKFDLAVANEIYLPNPGQACRTCDVARFCATVGGAQASEIDN